MNDSQETPPTTMPVENATTPIGAPIEKPAAVHTTAGSIASNDTGSEPLSPIDNEKPIQPVQGPPGPPELEYPPFKQQIIVMTAILLAVFLIALVGHFSHSV